MKKLFLATFAFLTLASFANEGETIISNTPAENTITEESDQEDVPVGYERRFSTITEAGTSFVYNKPYFNVYQAIGIRVNPYLFIGQGVGLQVSDNKMLQIQATADVRAYVLDKRITPLFMLQAGLNKVSKAPETTEQKRPGDTQFLMNIGSGVLFKARENASFTLNGGYSLFTDFKNNMHGGFIKIGYVF
ncbi:MAG: hypothetical protein IPM95_11630 [Sphingobacteriales bacterium]|jgi:hypothetical protein|nr:hypothetical protein [Sphingobacteriales bacterium]